MKFGKRLTFEVASGLASIISLFAWAGKEYLSFAPVTMSYLAFTVIFLFFVYSLIFMVQTYKEYEKVRKSQNDHLLSHKITHNLRNALSKLREIEFESKLNLDQATEDAHINLIKESDGLKVAKVFKTFGSKLADAVQRQIINSFIRSGIEESIRITIKSINPIGENQENWEVSTLVLDPKTWADSSDHYSESSTDKGNLIKGNSDFSEILLKKQKCFFCNDLSALGDDKYSNSASNWRSRYNSTLVLPIKNKSQNGASVVYYGFLTVDSLNIRNKKLFSDRDNDEILQIMAHAADTLASWFIRYDVHSEILEVTSDLQEGEIFLTDYLTVKGKI